LSWFVGPDNPPYLPESREYIGFYRKKLGSGFKNGTLLRIFCLNPFREMLDFSLVLFLRVDTLSTIHNFESQQAFLVSFLNSCVIHFFNHDERGFAIVVMGRLV
jgi:hypothetical protein